MSVTGSSTSASNLSSWSDDFLAEICIFSKLTLILKVNQKLVQVSPHPRTWVVFQCHTFSHSYILYWFIKFEWTSTCQPSQTIIICFLDGLFSSSVWHGWIVYAISKNLLIFAHCIVFIVVQLYLKLFMDLFQIYVVFSFVSEKCGKLRVVWELESDQTKASVHLC